MKKLLSILFIAVLTAPAVQAQTVDEIVENYLENIGGKKNWSEMTSMVMEGKMSMQGMDLPMKIYSKNPNKQYVELDIMGKTIVEAFDGETQWSINPFQGGETAQKGTEEQNKEAAKEQFESEFIDYKKKGHKLTLQGKEEIEGTECFKIEMVKKDGDEVTYFFDTENFVPIMTRTAITQEGPMKGKIAETYFSDYEEVDGFIIAHYTEAKMDGQTLQKMTIEKVQFNVDIDDSQFAMPAAK